MNLDELADRILQRLESGRPRALLLGQPIDYHNYIYVNEKPYEAVVIGQLPPAELLGMPNQAVCEALLLGLPVYLSPQKFQSPHAKLLCRELAEAERHLRQLGARPMDTEKRLITAQMAKAMRERGAQPPEGSRLTPLAREILEGSP